MISGVDSLMPLTHLAHPLSHNPSSNPQFVLHIYESLLFCPPPCCYIIFVSLPLCSSVLSFNVLIWVKSYDFYLSLINFTLHNTLQLHPRSCKWQDFVLFDHRVILHCIYIYHIFIHSSIEGHWGSFHTLAMVNSTAIILGVQVPLWNSTPESLG